LRAARFTTRYDDGDAFAMWGNLTIHLARDEDPDAHMTLVLYVDVDDADEAAERWRKRSWVKPPKTKTTAKRESRPADPGRQSHPLRRSASLTEQKCRCERGSCRSQYAARAGICARVVLGR